VKHFKHLFLLFVTLSFVAGSFTPHATAQANIKVSDTESVPAQDVPEIKSETPQSEPPAAEEPAEIDLSDPAIIDALDAREKADRAIADAVEAQRSAKAAQQYLHVFSQSGSFSSASRQRKMQNYALSEITFTARENFCELFGKLRCSHCLL